MRLPCPYFFFLKYILCMKIKARKICNDWINRSRRLIVGIFLREKIGCNKDLAPEVIQMVFHYYQVRMPASNRQSGDSRMILSICFVVDRFRAKRATIEICCNGNMVTDLLGCGQMSITRSNSMKILERE